VGKTLKPVMRPRTPAQHQPLVVPTAVIPKIQKNDDQEEMSQALSVQTPSAMLANKPTGFEAANIALASQELVVGQIYKLPLHRFQKSPNNARVYYLSTELDEMSESLSSKGQDTPAIGYVRDGKIVLTDGQKRFQAAANAGILELEVKVTETPASDADEYETSRRVNEVRSGQNGIDDAYRWKDLLARGVYSSQDELAERNNLKKEKVSKIMGITRIPERLLRMMLDHEKARAWSTAYLISTMFDDKKLSEMGAESVEKLAEEVIEEIIKKELNKAQVEALIPKKLNGPQRRAHAVSMPVKFGEWKGELKVFPGRGQLDMSFRNLPEAKVIELEDLLKRFLSGQLAN
jgi:ParB family transcriptional regulator, chromosome partitioning protein